MLLYVHAQVKAVVLEGKVGSPLSSIVPVCWVLVGPHPSIKYSLFWGAVGLPRNGQFNIERSLRVWICLRVLEPAPCSQILF